MLKFSFFLLFFAVFFIQAEDVTPLKKHTFGGQFAVGNVEHDSGRIGDTDVIQFYGFYNFAFTEYFSLEVGINSGADYDDWSCDEYSEDSWFCSNNDFSWSFLDDVEYSNVIFALKGVAPLSQRNSLYGKIGGQLYDYDIYKFNDYSKSDDGTGLFLEGGWQYQWDFGLGMRAGVQYIDMGDLESTTFTTGVSYSF
jgi:hypothetical protein